MMSPERAAGSLALVMDSNHTVKKHATVLHFAIS